MNAHADILLRILRHKREEIARRKAIEGLEEVRARAGAAIPPRDFLGAMRNARDAGRPAVIAEIKKASPSKGVIRDDFRPLDIAASYAAAGAACLSVLTDSRFFQGDDAFIGQAKSACDLPVLRKDFMVDAYQIWESRALGADCVLLVVAALTDAQLEEFARVAAEAGMSVLVEVHDYSELERALGTGLTLVGINNRDLRTFRTDLATTLDLLPHVPGDRLVVTESGINTADDVALMRSNGVHGFLVGEACMREPDPGDKIRELFFGKAPPGVTA